MTMLPAAHASGGRPSQARPSGDADRIAYRVHHAGTGLDEVPAPGTTKTALNGTGAR